LDKLMSENNLVAEDIERINVHCSEMAFRHCAWPYRAAGVTAAQMNMPFALAMMAVDRAAMGAQFREERLEDPKVLPMLNRIVVEPDPEYSKGGDETRHAARVILLAKSGQVFELEMWNRPGSPANPMSEAQLAAKFKALAEVSLPGSKVKQLGDLIGNLERHDFSDLQTLLVPD